MFGCGRKTELTSQFFMMFGALNSQGDLEIAFGDTGVQTSKRMLGAARSLLDVCKDLFSVWYPS